jgi:TonB-linked SusC/RagA family outer membrane protein
MLKIYPRGVKRFMLLIPALCFTLFAFSQQQNYTIQGKITSLDGEPLIGATVQVVALQSGTVTDIDGNYTFGFQAAPGSYQLRFSYVGYVTQDRDLELSTEGTLNFDVQLGTDILRLTEVVVTGTGGLTEKRQLGNSIATMQSAEIGGSGSVDVTGALSGKMAGIQVTQNSGDPAGGVSVRLRSASTVNGSSDPLYIIDGVIVNNSSTNVLNIRSVVQNRLSDVNPQDIERIEVIKGGAAAAIYGSRASNGVVQIWTKKGSSGKPKISFSTSVNFNSLRKARDFNEEPFHWTSSDITDNGKESVTRYDYQDMVFHNSLGTDNYISISGGRDNTKYFSSISYLNNEGIMKSTDYSRIAGRIRIDQILNDWASFSVGSYVARAHSNDMPNGGYGFGVLQTILFTNNRINPAKDENGNYPTMTFYPNILEYIETFDYQQLNNRSISDFQLKLNPYRGLSINYNVGYDHANSTGTSYSPIGTTTATDGRARTSTIATDLVNNDINIVYETDVAPSIKSTSAAGYTLQYGKTTISTISGSTLALGVQTTDGAGTISTDESRSERSIWGGYLQQTFGYNNKLFLTGAIRLDGASVFGEDERNQLYPKVSGSYILSEEDFWDNSLGNVFSSFKIRAAWGQAGNLTAIGPFDRLTNYGGVSLGGVSGLISPSTIGNPDLKPERQTEFEVGVDMTLLNNRVGVELTYYKQDIEDLLLERSLSPSTGASFRIENIGEMTNNGFEALITAAPIQTSDLKWNLTATFSTNENEVSGVEGEEIGIGNFGFAKARNGEPLGVFRQGYYARNSDGKRLV